MQSLGHILVEECWQAFKDVINKLEVRHNPVKKNLIRNCKTRLDDIQRRKASNEETQCHCLQEIKLYIILTT